MNLTYLEFDHARSAYDELDGLERTKFLERLTLSWMYHDHALEGVVLAPEDIERALSGQPVRNYCDGVVAKVCRERDVVAEHVPNGFLFAFRMSEGRTTKGKR